MIAWWSCGYRINPEVLRCLYFLHTSTVCGTVVCLYCKCLGLFDIFRLMNIYIFLRETVKRNPDEMSPQLIFHCSDVKISVMSQCSTGAVCKVSKNHTTSNYICYDEFFLFLSLLYMSANISSARLHISFLHAFEQQ